jgi:hypothetical protein
MAPASPSVTGILGWFVKVCTGAVIFASRSVIYSCLRFTTNPTRWLILPYQSKPYAALLTPVDQPEQMNSPKWTPYRLRCHTIPLQRPRTDVAPSNWAIRRRAAQLTDMPVHKPLGFPDEKPLSAFPTSESVRRPYPSGGVCGENPGHLRRQDDGCPFHVEPRGTSCLGQYDSLRVSNIT